MSRAVPHEKPHWNFVLGQALAGLEQLIRDLNICEDLKWRGYADVPVPDELLAIIDGLLAEQGLLYEGEVSRLKELRTVVQEVVTPAYQAGCESARQYWADASPDKQEQIVEFRAEDTLAEAWRRVPASFSRNEANWFLEGFCCRWSTVELLTY